MIKKINCFRGLKQEEKALCDFNKLYQMYCNQKFSLSQDKKKAVETGEFSNYLGVISEMYAAIILKKIYNNVELIEEKVGKKNPDIVIKVGNNENVYVEITSKRNEENKDKENKDKDEYKCYWCSSDNLENTIIDKLKQCNDNAANIIFIVNFRAESDFDLLNLNDLSNIKENVINKKKENVINKKKENVINKIKKLTDKDIKEILKEIKKILKDIKEIENKNPNLISGVFIVHFPEMLSENIPFWLLLKINPNALQPIPKEVYKNFIQDEHFDFLKLKIYM